MTDRGMVIALAKKVMRWKLSREWNGREFNGMVEFARPYACGIRWWPGCDERGWNPLESISDAEMLIGAIEMDVIIHRSRNDNAFHVWVVNSAWATNHFGEVPQPGDPNLYGYAWDERAARAISDAILKAVLSQTPKGDETR